MLNLPISRDGFFWAFSIASQLHQVPLATTIVLQKFQPPFSLASLRVAAEQFGFKVRQKAVPYSQLAKLSLPCLVTLIPAVEEVPMAVNSDVAVALQTVREYQMALLERVDEESVVLALACSKVTITLNRATFERRFAGEALIITPMAQEGSVPSRNGKKANGTDSNNAPGKTVVAWFVPQLDWLKGMFRSTR